MGQKEAVIESGRHAQGYHVDTWNGEDDSGHLFVEGVYFYRMVVHGNDGPHSETRKMIKFCQ